MNLNEIFWCLGTLFIAGSVIVQLLILNQTQKCLDLLVTCLHSMIINNNKSFQLNLDDLNKSKKVTH